MRNMTERKFITLLKGLSNTSSFKTAIANELSTDDNYTGYSGSKGIKPIKSFNLSPEKAEDIIMASGW